MRDIPPVPDHDIELAGGHLALDFANTVGGTHVRPTHDHLRDYYDVFRFAELAGGLEVAVGKRLRARAKREPRHAAAVYELAIALREAIWAVFSALASGDVPRAKDLELIEDAAEAGAARSRLLYEGRRFRSSLVSGFDDLERPLWSIGRAAIDLLSTGEFEHVKECASQTCEWVFLDRSRNHSRRWCDMSDCGNRAKAQRFQQKRKALTRS
jgi:predicted RNA-binding Zn ribbon-like protein